MIRRKNSYTSWFRAIAMAMACLFLVDDIAWVQPSVRNSYPDTALAVQSIFNPIIDAIDIRHRRQVELELSGIIAMALKGFKEESKGSKTRTSFININSDLDKRCPVPGYTGEGSAERALEVVGNPEILEDLPEKPVVIHLKIAAAPETRKYFKIILRGDKLDDILDAGNIRIIEEEPVPYKICRLIRAGFNGEWVAVENIRKLIEEESDIHLPLADFDRDMWMLMTSGLVRMSGYGERYKITDLSPPVWDKIDPILKSLGLRPTVEERNRAKEEILRLIGDGSSDSTACIEDALLADKVPDPAAAWAGWREYIAKRPAKDIFYSLSSEDRKGAEITYKLMSNYKAGISFLAKRKGEEAYKLAEESIRLINSNPYKYSTVELDNLRRLYLWSHHLCRGPPMISPSALRAFDRYAKSDSERLAMVDIDYLLWQGGPATEDEWYKQIVFWHELFIGADVNSQRLRESIRRWLLGLDKPKEVFVDRVPVAVRFADSPLDYIYGVCDYMFNDVPARQPFEDGNHRAGCIVMNYMFMKYLGLADFEIFSINYGKFDRRKTVRLNSIGGGGSYTATRRRFNTALREILNKEMRQSTSILTPGRKTKPEHISISNELLLLNRVSPYLRDYPVDETIDLLLVPREDLEANMRTWAHIIALNNRYGLDVNYIFRSDDEEYKAEAKRMLSSEIDEIDHIDKDRIKSRIVEAHRPNAFQVHIMRKEDLEKLKDVPEGVFPVALSEGAALDGTPLRDFMSASVIGLSQAACKSMLMENDPHLSEVLEQEILPRMQRIYQRLFPNRDIREIVTRETILNMIDDNSIVRKNIAIALALPPIVRAAIRYLKDYHDKMHLLQQAA